MSFSDISDFYIKTDTFPGYDINRVENVAFEDVIVAKVELILLTNKGECTDPDFGADIPRYLWKTKFPVSTIQQEIQEQFQKYIPELSISDYKIEVRVLSGNFQDIGIVQIFLGIRNVNILFK
jgi:phage baseplate assembly protein W